MRSYTTKFLLALLGVLLGLAAAEPATAQTAGSCSLGSATKDLSINNVRARLFNNGGLFWKGAGNVYNVPKSPEGQPITPNAIFASGIWIAGQVNGQLRAVAADYGNWELWPGPLTASGNLPSANCSQYDRIWLVSRADVAAYERGEGATPDLDSWPYQLGAPVIDGDGNPNNYNLAGGDRPDITGDQMAWWVMNDVGNVHNTTGTPPMGLEVQVSAFAFNLAGDIGNTTFYRYKLIYRGSQPLTNTWFGIWSDPDLGNATDDYVGSDTTLGLGYVYNGDNDDEGSDGYGSPPPATGYDFFQGPLVDAPGKTFVDPDGTVHENATRLKMTRFLYYNNDSSLFGNPRDKTTDWYNYLQGIWQDGTKICGTGNGYNPQCPVARADFMWPGDPVTKTGWSEFNIDGAGTPNTPSDRRFLMSTGPFTLKPGDVQVIVYGIVWAKGENNLDSVVKLRQADALAQAAFDANFQLPEPPAAPRVEVSELDGAVVLTWGYLPSDNNFLEQYEAFNPFSYEGGDRTYNFEGYKVYQYPTEEYNPDEARLIATYDVKNGVTRVLEATPDGLVEVTANGTDSGTQQFIRIDGLTNYREYYFGVQAYAYNGDTDVNKVYPSPTTRVKAVPSRRDARAGGTLITAEAGQLVDVAHQGVGEGIVTATVVDPAKVTGDTYAVEFYQYTDNSDPDHPATFTTYDIVNKTTGEKIVDGRAYAQRYHAPVPQKEGIITADGLLFSVTGPPPGISRFLVTANAAGPLNPPEIGTFAFNNNHFPTLDGLPADGTNDRPSTRQQANSGARWGINVGGGDGTFDTDGTGYLYRSIFGRSGNADRLGAYDYEIRFTAAGGKGWRAFDDGSIMDVPFEVWRTGVSTPNDPSDDVRLIPAINDICTQRVFDICGDHPVSGGADDPLSDWIYIFLPENQSPGEAGYNGFFFGPDDQAGEVLGRQVLVCWNCGAAPPYTAPLPETGTVFRIITNKPNAPGDVFTINTAPVAPLVGVDSVRTFALEQIGITPNPYKGASAYEVSNLEDVARFTNLPDEATIRIFTLSGVLIKTINHNVGTYRDWDLKTDEGLPISSGIYLIHVDVPGVGERVLKFGVIKKRIQLDLL